MGHHEMRLETAMEIIPCLLSKVEYCTTLSSYFGFVPYNGDCVQSSSSYTAVSSCMQCKDYVNLVAFLSGITED